MSLKQIVKKLPLVAPMAYKAASLHTRYMGPGKFRERLATSDETKIVIGAGDIYDKGWVPAEYEFLDLLKQSDWDRFFQPDSIDAMLAEHVWEHLTPENGKRAAAMCYRYLKPGGYLRVAVPDGNHPDPSYIEHVRIGGTGPGAHDHKSLHTHESFSDTFSSAGFRIELLEYFDADGNFHHNPWDPAKGSISRSKDHDRRNAGGELKYTSVLLDAIKD